MSDATNAVAPMHPRDPDRRGVTLARGIYPTIGMPVRFKLANGDVRAATIVEVPDRKANNNHVDLDVNGATAEQFEGATLAKKSFGNGWYRIFDVPPAQEENFANETWSL